MSRGPNALARSFLLAALLISIPMDPVSAGEASAPTPAMRGAMQRMLEAYKRAPALGAALHHEQDQGGRLIEVDHELLIERPNRIVYRHADVRGWSQTSGFTVASDGTRMLVRAGQGNSRTITLPAPADLEVILADAWWNDGAGLAGLAVHLLSGSQDWPRFPLARQVPEGPYASEDGTEWVYRYRRPNFTLEIMVSAAVTPVLRRVVLETELRGNVPQRHEIRVTQRALPKQGVRADIAQYLETQLELGSEGWPAWRLETPKQVGNFQLMQLDGSRLRRSDLAAHKGSIAFSWYAGDTKRSGRVLNLLARLRPQMETKGLRVLTVNSSDSYPTIQAFLRRQRIQVPVLLDPHGAFSNGLPRAITILDANARAVAGFDADHPFLEHLLTIAMNAPTGPSVAIKSTAERLVEVSLTDEQGRPWALSKAATERHVILLFIDSRRRRGHDAGAARELRRAMRLMRRSDLDVYAVDTSGNPYRLQHQLQEEGIAMPVLFDAGDAQPLMRKANMKGGRGTSMVVFKRGAIFLAHLERIDAKQLVHQIPGLLDR